MSLILLSKLFYEIDPSGTEQMSAYYRFCLSAVIFVPLIIKAAQTPSIAERFRRG